MSKEQTKPAIVCGPSQASPMRPVSHLKLMTVCVRQHKCEQGIFLQCRKRSTAAEARGGAAVACPRLSC